MADQSLSVQTQTTTVSGTFVYIIIPDGGGGWLDRRIAYLDFLDSIQDQIDLLKDVVPITSVNLTGGVTNSVDTGQATNEPAFIRVIDPSIDDKDISQDMIIQRAQSGNWFIKLTAPINYTNLTIEYYG